MALSVTRTRTRYHFARSGIYARRMTPTSGTKYDSWSREDLVARLVELDQAEFKAIPKPKANRSVGPSNAVASSSTSAPASTSTPIMEPTKFADPNVIDLDQEDIFSLAYEWSGDMQNLDRVSQVVIWSYNEPDHELCRELCDAILAHDDDLPALQLGQFQIYRGALERG